MKRLSVPFGIGLAFLVLAIGSVMLKSRFPIATEVVLTSVMYGFLGLMGAAVLLIVFVMIYATITKRRD